MENLRDFEANEAKEYTDTFDNIVANIEDIVIKHIPFTDVEDVISGGSSTASASFPEVFATFKKDSGVGIEVVMNLDPKVNKYHTVFDWDYRVTFFIEEDIVKCEDGSTKRKTDQEISYMFNKDNKTVKRFDLNFVEHNVESIFPADEEALLRMLIDGKRAKTLEEMHENIAMEASFGSDNFTIPDLAELHTLYDRISELG